ncbi:MAG: glycosyltransferase family 4 protein [Gammaproteobacteria bacterium]|nr:glycosyltransferase family 4 protein [Gammaproteobacteria bacterium]
MSALDFKEKSIQVLRNTPEAYAAAGWETNYLVARDTSRMGSYFYEQEFDPVGVTVTRFPYPLKGLRNVAGKTLVGTVVTKLATLLVVVRLAVIGARILREKDFDVIYGYEVHGVLALGLLRLLRRTGWKATVTRFQGSHMMGFIESRRWLKLLLNFDHLIALRLASDLCIMTDDGTRGDLLIRSLNPKAHARLRFWTNGVARFTLNRNDRERLRQAYDLDRKFVLLSVSRLEQWKRVDRSIRALARLDQRGLAEEIVYLIVGEGTRREAWSNLAKSLGIANRVRFIGAVPHEEVEAYFVMSDLFLSTYDSSNVGNPLLEAVRAGKPVITLDNGDTGRWIEHEVNGLIFPPVPDPMEAIADGIERIRQDSELRERLERGMAATEDRLWTWGERMQAEIDAVRALL